MSDPEKPTPKGRPFASKDKDHENLRVDGEDLLWNGRKIKTEGWSRSEKLTVIGIVVGSVIAIWAPIILGIANWEKIKPVFCDFGEFEFCIPPSNDFQVD